MGLRKGINVVLENNDGTNNSRHVRKLRASVYKLDSSVNDDQTHTYININIYICVCEFINDVLKVRSFSTMNTTANFGPKPGFAEGC